ncbi:MAG: DUF2191 domain-containing protein [Acidobacteria bacterium]|nr:DUF2191 domain-containing protein [Acidobacteriota bacterium]
MSIRTTVTLDEDVFERLKEASRSRGVPFRQALNDTLRVGLVAAREPGARRKFRIEPRHMGVRAGLNYDNVSALLELAEGETYR